MEIKLSTVGMPARLLDKEIEKEKQEKEQVENMVKDFKCIFCDIILFTANICSHHLLFLSGCP